MKNKASKTAPDPARPDIEPEENKGDSPRDDAHGGQAGKPGDRTDGKPRPGREAEETVTLKTGEWEKTRALAALAEERREDLLRMAADLDNFRKRTEREKEQLSSFVELRMLNRLLPALDNIEHALAACREECSGPEKGLVIVLRELRKSIYELGLSPLDLAGKPFDPEGAEVVEIVETGDAAKDNLVIEVVRPGYAYRDRVLRPAMVRIARHRPPGGEEGGEGRQETSPDASSG